MFDSEPGLQAFRRITIVTNWFEALMQRGPVK
jgi:pectate lyase